MLISCQAIAKQTNTLAVKTLLAQAEQLKDSNLSKALAKLTSIEQQLSNLTVEEQLNFYKLQAEIFIEMSKYQLAKDSASKGLELAKQLTSPSILIADLSYSRGFALESLGNANLASQDYLSGLDVAESLNDKLYIARGLINMGALYYQKERYDKSLIMLNDALKIAMSLNDEELKGYIYSELGILYAYLGEKDKTLEFYRQSYQHFVKAGKLLYALNSLANIGIFHLDHDQYDKAIEVFKQIISSPNAIMTDQFYYNAYSGLAWAYNNKAEKEPEIAYQYILIAGQYLTSIEQVDIPFYYLIDKSYILENLKRYDEVLEHLYQAEKLLTTKDKLENSWNYLTIIALRADIYFAQGRYETAYQLKSEYVDRFVQVQELENVDAIQDVRLKFESEQADLQKKILEKQRGMQSIKLTSSQAQTKLQQRYLWFSGVLILLLIWGIVKLVRGQHRLLYMSRTDGLTGIANRRRLEQLGRLEFVTAQRNKQSFCVLMVDVDNFKQVNDQHGHKIGDQVLKDIALLGQHALRTRDQFGRFGGEEFAVILPNTDLTQGLVIAERLKTCVHQHHWQQFSLPAITISIGLACFEQHKYKNFNDLLKYADEMLYQAKSEGRNRVCA